MQDCVSGFVQAGKQFFSRGPPGPADRRTEGTQANHIPVSDLPGGPCGLRAFGTKTPPLLIRVGGALSVSLVEVDLLHGATRSHLCHDFNSPAFARALATHCYEQGVDRVERFVFDHLNNIAGYSTYWRPRCAAVTARRCALYTRRRQRSQWLRRRPRRQRGDRGRRRGRHSRARGGRCANHGRSAQCRCPGRREPSGSRCGWARSRDSRACSRARG